MRVIEDVPLANSPKLPWWHIASGWKFLESIDLRKEFNGLDVELWRTPEGEVVCRIRFLDPDEVPF